MITPKPQKHLSILSAATIIAISSIASKALGLIRDRVLVSQFKTSQLDVYYSAFRIPDFLYNIIIGGVISAAFVPVFTEFIVKKQLAKAWHVTNSLINILLAALLACTAALYLAAPALVSLLAHGFSPEKAAETVSLTRIMLCAPVFFALSNILSGILNSFKKFFIYSLAPIMYNAGIIAGTIILGPSMGIKGVAIGVVVGAALHFGIQLPSAIRAGYRYQPLFRLTDDVKALFRMISARIIGLVAFQLDLVISTTIASGLAPGSISIFNLANNIQSVPVSMFGISFAIAAFPILSELSSRDDTDGLRDTFSKTFRRIIFFIIPSSVLILLLRAQIVRVFLGSNKFSWDDTVHTARVLGYFALSLVAQSLVPLLSRTFYAKKDVRTPVLVSIFSVIVDVVCSVVFSRVYGVEGLGIAFAASSFTNVFLLLFFLHLKLKNLDDATIMASMLKTTLASLVMGMYSYGTLYAVAPLVNMQTFAGIATQGACAALTGVISFLCTSYLLKNDELNVFGKLKQITLRQQRPLSALPQQEGEDTHS